LHGATPRPCSGGSACHSLLSHLRYAHEKPPANLSPRVLAMIQSLKAIEDLEAFFSGYGFLIVDECHHLPAFTFETCVRRAPIRFTLGLTATPYRRDGLQDILYMQCGPIRYKMQDLETALVKQLVVRETSFTQPVDGQKPIQEIFRELVQHEARNALIREDVRQAVSEGRRCLILSQWKEHCRLLAEALATCGLQAVVLDGTLGKKERKTLLQRIESTPRAEPLIVIATGQYLGEGFDCPQIDTLFLVFPLAFKGKLVQYVGRALRSFEGKQCVAVYDYADLQVPVLWSMHLKRLRVYKTLGFEKIDNAEVGSAACQVRDWSCLTRDESGRTVMVRSAWCRVKARSASWATRKFWPLG